MHSAISDSANCCSEPFADKIRALSSGAFERHWTVHSQRKWRIIKIRQVCEDDSDFCKRGPRWLGRQGSASHRWLMTGSETAPITDAMDGGNPTSSPPLSYKSRDKALMTPPRPAFRVNFRTERGGELPYETAHLRWGSFLDCALFA